MPRFTQFLPCLVHYVEMASRISSKLSRFSTGMTAFVAAGLLVYSILQENGGVNESQRQWQDAASRAIPIERKASYLDQILENKTPQYIDQTNTSSIADVVKADEAKATAEVDVEEPSVLALIRENSDVAPGVSSGTARVSVVVKKGDTLFNISQRHGLSVPDLARLNGLNEPYTIKIGQTLYVAR